MMKTQQQRQEINRWLKNTQLLRTVRDSTLGEF